MTKPTKLPRQRLARVRGFILLAIVALLLLIGGASAYVLFAIVPNVPAIDAVTDYRPKIPLRVYTADGALIGEFGVERRDFVPVDKMPDLMKKAVLAIEDTRFYEHNGIDWIRAMGAAKANLGGGFRQGGSTITMQVARDFFLTKEKLISRKLTEIALTYKIEAALTKDQILELYMNQIYLGQRAYGFSGAARAYFGKSLDDLTVAETAMLAGLPQNPSRVNPAVNPNRARQRQHAVLKRMYELDYITEDQYNAALEEKLRVNRRGQEFDVHAEYVAELARQAVYEQFGDDSYTRGITVTTTILKADQQAAYESMRRNVLAYDQRHGYRGPEARIDLPADADEREDAIVEALQKRMQSDGLIPAVVLSASPTRVQVETVEGNTFDITGAGLKFAERALSDKARESVRITPGAVIRISRQGKDGWAITQVPQVAAAFVSLDAETGAYHALVGGFDFGLQKFNHVTQAWRQPGSAIKPFIYAAALQKGYSPATLVLDAPLDMPGEDAGETWSPQNDDGEWSGPITMRYSLAHSKNVPSVRILRAVSVPFAHDFLGRFGFDAARQPKNYTLALGTGAVTPLQLAGAYAVFANGGYKVQPYLIAKITDGDGKVISETKPPEVRQEANRVLDSRNAFITDSMLRDVARYGTGAAATQRLGRSDLAGKTGTTNDAVDGWFAGYAGGVVAVAWMGYDEPRSLGGREFGATLSLPIWIDYMKVALAKRPAKEFIEPDGVVRDGEDWAYEEFVGLPELKGIDLEEAVEPPPEGEAPPVAPLPAPAPAQPVAPVAPVTPATQPAIPTATP